ncbi:hypothetical protein HY990_06945 [Candidatus Micrarchaeota archaeon]|nr:hypothetical protein [Candidatus Micrarchaeota archaeon]
MSTIPLLTKRVFIRSVDFPVTRHFVVVVENPSPGESIKNMPGFAQLPLIDPSAKLAVELRSVPSSLHPGSKASDLHMYHLTSTALDIVSALKPAIFGVRASVDEVLSPLGKAILRALRNTVLVAPDRAGLWSLTNPIRLTDLEAIVDYEPDNVRSLFATASNLGIGLTLVSRVESHGPDSSLIDSLKSLRADFDSVSVALELVAADPDLLLSPLLKAQVAAISREMNVDVSLYCGSG